MVKCEICGSSDFENWYSGGVVRGNWQKGEAWDVIRCRTCRHGVIHPAPTAEKLNEYYSAGYDPYDSDHGLAEDMAAVVRAAKATGEYRYVRIAPGMRILDVGCGGGSFLAVCRALGADIFGVEPSDDGVATCQKAGIPVFHGNLTAFLDSTDQTFDLITTNHVVEHHPEPTALIHEMTTLLAPDGEIYIAVPNADCFFSRKLKARWHSSDLPVHLQHFSEPSLRRLVEGSGLTIKSLRTISENSLPNSAAQYLRAAFMIPQRLSLALAGGALRRDGWLGQRIDNSGQGEALVLIAGRDDGGNRA
ncbi:MAG: methyltransferase domain-containing protein [Paracoccaceae bacterium]|jgi:SAM-dependent methyltransferase|nr:methyltransferase domain-containing protein [Paracoccaceae bacterium]MDP7186101.1 methyltransferase domain-containing protein [Paracoccaceae bacterium]